MTGQEKGDHASQPLKVKNQVMTCDETLSAYFFFLNKALMLSIIIYIIKCCYIHGDSLHCYLLKEVTTWQCLTAFVSLHCYLLKEVTTWQCLTAFVCYLVYLDVNTAIPVLI